MAVCSLISTPTIRFFPVPTRTMLIFWRFDLMIFQWSRIEPVKMWNSFSISRGASLYCFSQSCLIRSMFSSLVYFVWSFNVVADSILCL